MMQNLKYGLISLLFILTGYSHAQDNPFAGSTWEMVSAEYTWGDSTFVRPTSSTDKGLSIWGQTKTVALWQDPGMDESFFVGHNYTLEGDSVVLNIEMWPDSKWIGRTFKLHFQINGGLNTLRGVIPENQWGLMDYDMDLVEVWKRVD